MDKLRTATLKTIARISVGLTLLAALLLMLDLPAVFRSIANSHFSLLVAAFLLFTSQGIFESFRLKITFSEWGIDYLRSFRLFLVGMFFSNFMPGLIGADIYQIQQMHSLKPGFVKPISLSLLLRTSGILVNLGIALWLMISGSVDFVMDPLQPTLSYSTGLVATGILVFVAFFFFSQAKAERIDKIRRECLSAVSSLSALTHLYLLCFGLFVVIFRALSYFILVQAVGSFIGFYEALLAVTITALALVIPISFAGIGVREVSLTVVLVACGMTASSAAAVALLSRCFIWLLSILGGIWFATTKKS
jgi:uncharacterized membrane protein YbhN (UPF0104 family)